MPVRSLRSSVLRWPDRATVEAAVRAWAAATAAEKAEVCRVGFFGSYARGDWGVGSDVDLIVVVERAGLPFERRAIEFDTTPLPVPADLFVYTLEEWDRSSGSGSQRAVADEVVWVLRR